MRYLILVLWLCKLEVEASVWTNRTIRVDLATSLMAVTKTVIRQKEFTVHSETTANIIDASNGQYPWSIHIIAWANSGVGHRVGNSCTSSIISENFALSELTCTGRNTIYGPATVIQAHIGEARAVDWSTPRFMRQFWYIEPSNENSPSIVLLRFHEPLTFNPNIQPIRLPAPGNFSYVSIAYVWAPQQIWLPLQYVHANIVRNSACSFHVNLANHEMCSFVSGLLGLDFYAGGAWVTYEYNNFEYHSTLAGIHQHYFGVGNLTFGIATRVSDFVEWIEGLTADVEV